MTGATVAPPRRPPAGASRAGAPRAGDPRRRLVAMVVLMAIGAMVVVGRLTQVQLLSSGSLAARSASQTVRSIDLPGERGAIFDRNGRELALSVPQKTVWADPRLVADPAGAAAALAPVLGVDEQLLRSRLARPAAFVYLARQVPDEVAMAVEDLGLAGVFFIDEPARFNPSGPLAAPVLGQVGIDNNGLSGLELVFEEQLAGNPGLLVVEQAPDGVAIPAGRRQLRSPSPGDDLILTLDRSLQFEAERLLARQIVSTGALGGVVVAMDPRTGDVLAMASLEAGEAATATEGGTSPATEADPAATAGAAAGGAGDDTYAFEGGVVPSRKNKAVTDVFEPGSVNKVITVAAAIEEGLHRPSDTLMVADHLQVADHRFTDHDRHPTAPWSITDILVRSSNVGSILIGQALGKERLDAYLRRFGFGTETGLGFPGESAGLMLPTDRWSGTTIGTVPIGQGISVTALQMLGAYNTIANGGQRVTPRLVKATVDGHGKERPVAAAEAVAVVSERTARQVADMLSEVVRSGTGTRAAVPGYTVAGKTGTARKPNEGSRGYKAGAYVSSFAGFVPAEDPRLSIIVVLDEPSPIYGGVVAAPVFSELAAYALRQLRIPPPAAVTGAEPQAGGEPALGAEANDAASGPAAEPTRVRARPAEGPAAAPVAAGVSPDPSSGG